jgi:hypothetical protein
MTTAARINLLPPRFRQARRFATLRRRWIITGGCYVLLLAAGSFAARAFDTLDDGSVRQEIARLRNQNAEFDSRQKPIMNELARLANDRQLKDLVNSPVNYAVLLTALGKCVHEDAILTGLRWEVIPISTNDHAPAVAAAEMKNVDPYSGPVRLKVELTGLVKEQPAIGRLVRSIHDSQLFDQVRLLKSSREGFMTSNAFSFQIECEITASRIGGGS